MELIRGREAWCGLRILQDLSGFTRALAATSADLQRLLHVTHRGDVSAINFAANLLVGNTVANTNVHGLIPAVNVNAYYSLMRINVN